MRVYKGINFGKGVTCTFSKFLKGYAGHLAHLTDAEKKEAYNVAYDKTTKKRSKPNVSKSKK